MIRRPLRQLVLGAAAFSFALHALGQTPDLRPGLWEFTMSAPGTQGFRQRVCFTPAMVKDMKALAAKGDTGSDCKAANEKVAGKSRSFDVSCTEPQKYDARITVTVESPDSFSMTQEYVSEAGGKTHKGSMTMAYRRVGECK